MQYLNLDHVSDVMESFIKALHQFNLSVSSSLSITKDIHNDISNRPLKFAHYYAPQVGWNAEAPYLHLDLPEMGGMR